MMSISPPPATTSINSVALAAGDQKLRAFLEQQVADIEVDSEIAPGCWALFAHPDEDDESRVLADSLLESAPFPFQTGPSDDGSWRIYYIRTPAKATARHWLDDTLRVLSGRIREASPIQTDALNSLLESPMAHRIARQIAAQYEAGNFPIGGIRDPRFVRGLLDRIHVREPLFLAALHTLIQNHLIDYLTLNQQMIEEDLQLLNDLTKGSVSQDPFFKSRQESVAAIRTHLIENRILNPIDQQKHRDVTNPYASIAEMRFQEDAVLLRVDGLEHEIDRTAFVESIRAIRLRCYLGESIEDMGTNAPWVTAGHAYPLRFVQQHVLAHPETSALHWLYILERAAERRRTSRDS